MKNYRNAITVAAMAIWMSAPLTAQKPGPAQVALQAAIDKEMADGDLKGAIALYEKTVAVARNDRGTAAKALIRMAECYQKLGSSESRKLYERVLREYGDQPESVAAARMRLAVLMESKGFGGMTSRQIWAWVNVSPQGSVSSDGRYLSFVDMREPVRQENLALRDMTTGQNRVLTNHGAEEMAESSIFSPDGKQIAYAVDWDKPQHGYEVRMIGVDGSRPRVVFPHQQGIHDMALHGWSHDGKSLLAMMQRSGESQIVWINVADGTVHKVLGRPRAGSGYRSPRAGLSPDSRYIVYEAVIGSEEQQRDIRVVAADGSGDRPLVESRFDDYLLGWLPDGSGVLFGSNRSGAYDVWMQTVLEGQSPS